MRRRGARGWIALFLSLAAVCALSAAVANSPRARAAEAPPTDIQLPEITGTAKPGETLTASPGAWTGDPTSYSYKWQVCFGTTACLVRQESPAPTYLVGPRDAFQTLTVTVTATNKAGSATAASQAVKVEPAWHFATGPPRREAIAWGAARPSPWSTAKTLAIGVDTGQCVGEESFRFGKAQIRERASSKQFPFPSAIITTSIVWPGPTEIVGTVNPGEVAPACAGIGIGARRTVKLKRPVARLFIYDGSKTPPHLVLQPAKALPWTFERVVGPRTIEIGVRYAGCAGVSIKPHVVERPGRAVLTAYGESPEHRGSHRCLRVRGTEYLQVDFHNLVDGLTLFDGSFDPARRRSAAGQ